MSTPASPMSTLASAAPGLNPAQPPTPPSPVQASPIPAPQEQTTPQDNAPQAGGILKGLYGKTLGKAMRGLGMVDTSYTVDPDTGKTVPVQTKAAPGETAKAILAAGLLGAHGIGPQGGQMNFAQGLLSGLSGGMDASRELQQQKDAKARADAQQQFENELKTKQDKRADQEIQMRKTLDDAMVSNYNVDRMAKSYSLVRLKNEDQQGAVQTLVTRDKPLVDMYTQSNVQPLHTAVNADEFQNLLKDDANDISLHKVVPVITGYEAHPNTDGSISYQPVGALYPVATHFTSSMLGDLKAAGVKEDDPMYKEVEQDVKNNVAVDPRKMIAVQNELGKRFDYAKNASEIAANNARIAQARVSEMEAGIRARLANLQLQDAESIKSGKSLFSIIGDPKGMDIGTGKNKTHVTIPTTPDGKYNFSQLKPEQKSDLRDYLNAVYGQSYEEYDRSLQAANKNGADPSKDAGVQQAASTLSTFSNMLNSLNGTANWPGHQPAGSMDPRISSFVGQVKDKKITDPKAIEDAMTSAGYPAEAQAQVWKALGIAAPVKKPLATLNPMGQAVVSGAKTAGRVLSDIPFSAVIP